MWHIVLTIGELMTLITTKICRNIDCKQEYAVSKTDYDWLVCPDCRNFKHQSIKDYPTYASWLGNKPKPAKKQRKSVRARTRPRN